MSLTVRQYLYGNSQPLYGLERTDPVNLYVLFYHNLIVQSFLDFKRLSVKEDKEIGLAVLYWAVSRLILYLEDKFTPIPEENRINYNLYTNIMDIEHEIATMSANINSWLLGVTDYKTLDILKSLNNMLPYLYNLTQIVGTTVEELLDIAVQLFDKKWKFPSKDEATADNRRLDVIRKKLLEGTDAEEDPLKNKFSAIVQKKRKLKRKKTWVIGSTKSVSGNASLKNLLTEIDGRNVIDMRNG